MKKNLNAIYLSKGMINVPQVTVGDPVKSMEAVMTSEKMSSEEFKTAMAVSIELMRFGKILSPEALYGITLLNPDEQIKLALDVKTYLESLYGDGEYHTLFGDFPHTVLRMTDKEMLIHQIIHYWGAALGSSYWPARNEENDSENISSFADTNLDVCCKDKYDVIAAGCPDDLAKVILNLVGSQQSLTDWDKDVIYTVYSDIDSIPFSPMAKLSLKTANIPFKETLCLVMSACPEAACIKDINDVLRVAMHLSGGDISLAPIPKVKDLGWKKEKMSKEDKKPWNFKNFNNKETRMLLSNINSIVGEKNQGALADMKKYALRWVRLGEKIHPGSTANMKKYPNAAWAFKVIRNNIDKVKTFGSELEAAKLSMDLSETLRLLETRPGELARQIDWLLRTFVSNSKGQVICKDNLLTIMDVFNRATSKFSTKIIYELLDHFKARGLGETSRQVFIKGARKPVELASLPQMDETVAGEVINALVAELIKRMAAKEDLSGYKVILDEDLRDIMIPKNMRSVNEATAQLARGTKIHLPDISKLLRFYLFWKDEHGTEDLDLHVRFYDESFNQKAYISWDGSYSLVNGARQKYAQFSGDVRHKRGNCAEYIDVDIDGALYDGLRYLVADARDFNGKGFNSAHCGLMARDKWGTPGEVTWAPSTVENGFKICSTTQNVILAIIDLKERKMIYVDEDFSGVPYTNKASDDYEAKILERYVNGLTKAFFNALTLISTYYLACGAEVVTSSHDAYNTAKDTAKVQLEAFQKELPNADHQETKDLLNKKIDELKKNIFVGFDEVSTDYAKLFRYMF